MKNRNILEIGENALLIGSGVGSVASVLSQQALYTVAPLSMLVMVSLANRRRFEREVNKSTADAMARFDHQMSQELTTLRQQVVSLPNRLEVTGIKKTVLQKQQEALVDFGKTIEGRLAKLEQAGTDQLRRDLSQLQEQHGQMSEQMHGLSSYLHRVATAGKMDAIEKAISELRHEVEQTQNRLQTLANEPRNNVNLNAFQDQINHLNRRLNNLPPPFDASALRQDMEAVIKLVGDLVPKRDLSRVMFEMEQLRQQFMGIEQTVASLRISAPILRKQMDSLSSRVEAIQNVGNFSADASQFEAQLADVRARLSEFSTDLTDLEQRFEQGPTSPEVLSLPLFDEDLDLSDPEQLESMLGLFSQDLDEIDLEDLDNLLEPTTNEQESSSQGSNGLVARAGVGNSRVLQDQMQRLADRLHSLEQRQQNLTQADVSSPVGDLMLAIPMRDREGLPTLLEQVLSDAQKEIVVVFPSPARCQFSDRLMEAIQGFLQRKGVLKLGFGFLDAHQGGHRYLDTQWTTDLAAQQRLLRTLNQLAQLKQNYPKQFAFKVLGANENFILCDRRLAVLGVQTLSISSAVFPQLEVGLRTTQANILKQLQQRFEQPAINAEDPATLFQRAITRHELGDRPGAIQDLNHVLQLNPQDDVAYNYRGVVHFELGDIPGAIADFDHALRLNAQNLPARCNRGHALIQVNEREQALRDFDAAISQDDEATTAYFHRGLTRSRLEDRRGAIADYSRVIELVPDAAIAYFYRSLAYTRLNQIDSAIEDLQQAIPQFEQQANPTYVEKARTMLTRLQQFSAKGTAQAAKADVPKQPETSSTAQPTAKAAAAQPASEKAEPQNPASPAEVSAKTKAATRKTGFQSFVPAGAQAVNLKSGSQPDDDDTVVFAYLPPSQSSTATSSWDDDSAISDASLTRSEASDFFEPSEFPEASDLPAASDFIESQSSGAIVPNVASSSSRMGQAEADELEPLDSETSAAIAADSSTIVPNADATRDSAAAPDADITSSSDPESTEIAASSWAWDDAPVPESDMDLFGEIGGSESDENPDQIANQTANQPSIPQAIEGEADPDPTADIDSELTDAENPLASMSLGDLFGMDESESATPDAEPNPIDRAEPPADNSSEPQTDLEGETATAASANTAPPNRQSTKRAKQPDLGQVTLETAFWDVDSPSNVHSNYRPKTLDQGFLGSRARQARPEEAAQPTPDQPMPPAQTASPVPDQASNEDSVFSMRPDPATDPMSGSASAELGERESQVTDQFSTPQAESRRSEADSTPESAEVADNPLASMSLSDLFGLDDGDTSSSADDANRPDRGESAANRDPAPLTEVNQRIDPDIDTDLDSGPTASATGASQVDLGQVTLDNAFWEVKTSPAANQGYRPKTLDQGFLGSRGRQPIPAASSQTEPAQPQNPEVAALAANASDINSDLNQDPIDENDVDNASAAGADDNSMTLGDMDSLFGF